MADVTSLIIKVNSTDVETTRKRLRELGITAQDTSAKVSGSSEKMSRASDNLSASLKRAAAAFIGIQAAQTFVRMADEISQVEARIKLVTSASEDFAKIQAKVRDVANKNLQSLSATANLYGKLTPALKALGRISQDAIDTTDAFGKALRIGGASAQEAASATLQFAQAIGSGVLRGEEFNAIAEVSPRILKAIADGSGLAAGSLRKLAADGVLSASLVSTALQSQLGVLEREASQIPATVSGAMQVFKNEILTAIDEINKSAQITALIKATIQGVSAALSALGGVIAPVFTAMTTFVKTGDGAIGAFKDTMIIASGAAAGLAISLNFSAALATARIGLGLLTFQLGLATAGMTALGVATGVLKAALLGLVANPLFVIGAGIAYVYNEYRKFNNAQEEAADKSGMVTASLKSQNEERDRLLNLLGKTNVTQASAAEESARIAKETRDKFIADEKAKLEASNVAAKAAGQQTINVQNALATQTRVYDENGKLRDQITQKIKAEGEAAKKEADAQKERDSQRKKNIAEQKSLQEAADKARRDGLQSIADKVATFKMDEFERMEFDFAKLSPSADQLASFTAYVDQLKRLTNSQAELEAFGAVIDRIFTEQEDAAKAATKSIDDFLTKDFGSNLASGFDKAGQSLGAFVNGFDKLIQAQSAYDKARQAASGDAVELAKIEAKQQANQIGLYGDLAGSAKGFFKEGSKGYKALQTAEQVFRAFQLAKTIQTTLAQVTGYGQVAAAAAASAPVQIAANQAVGASAAATAVATQGAGDPYTAFPRIAAMIALMAGIGFAVSGSGKKGPGFTDNNGTGTVLGDSGAQSKSIKNSIEALESAASLENRISSAMLASLKNIEANIGGLASLIVRGDVGGGLAANVNTGFKMDGIGKTLNFLANPLPFLDFLGLGKALGKVLGGLFGSKSKITGQGLTAVSQTLGDIMQNGFDLLEFVAIQTKKKSFGITTSTKNSIRTSMADPELTRQFGLIFSDFGNAIVAAADPLGFSTEDIAKRLESFVVDIGKINLKGLKGEEIQEKLEAVFGAQADKMAEFAFPMLTEFQKVGEGLFETVVRVASGIEQADTLLTRLGLTAVNYTELLNTQGDIATEIIRQSVLLTDRTKGIAGGFAEIVANFQGTGEEITDLVLQLRDMQDAIRATGKAGEYLTTFMIAGAGGVDRLTDGLSTYFDDFLTPAEKAAQLMERVGFAFSSLNIAMPQSIKGFRDLVTGIDISTEAGQKLYGQVIALAPAFSDLQDATSTLLDAISQAYDREASTLRDTVTKFSEIGKSLRDFADSLIGALQSPAATLERLRGDFNSLIMRGRLGDTEAAGGIPAAGKALADAVTGQARTAQDAAREIAKIRANALSVAAVADRQKTVAQMQLDALTEQVSALGLLNESVLTVAEAIKAFKDQEAAASAATQQRMKEIADKAAADAAAAAAANKDAIYFVAGRIDFNRNGVISALDVLASKNANQSDALATRLTAELARLGLTQVTSAQIAAILGSPSADIAALVASADANKNGVLTQIELDKFRNDRLVQLLIQSGELRGAIQTGFTTIDSNLDGKITSAEMQKYLKDELGIVASNNSIRDLIASVDAGGNGTIERLDLLADEVKRQRAVEAANIIGTGDAAKLSDSALVTLGQSISKAVPYFGNYSGSTEQEIERAISAKTGLSVSEISTLGSSDISSLAKNLGINLGDVLSLGENVFSKLLGEPAIGKVGLSTASLVGNAISAATGRPAPGTNDFSKPSEATMESFIAAQLGISSSAISALSKPELQKLANKGLKLESSSFPQFATGGMHSGGLRLVGENGPELEYTGPSRIFNAGQTSSMLDNSDQIAEMRALRDEMKGYLWSISKSTLRTADRLDRWDDGDRMNVRIDNESDDPALVRTVA